VSQIPTQQYTARSYQSTIEALVVLLRAKFPDGHWEKLLEQDVPRAMMACLAWMHDQDSFYMNRRWINTYLDLADDREAGIHLCAQLGYRMRPKTAASIPVRLYPQPTKAVPIVIPAGTRVPYGDTFFEFLEDATVPADAEFWPSLTSTDVVALTEGQTVEATFTSDGQPWQVFAVPFENVIDGSVVVEVAGEEWEEVLSLIYVEGDTLGKDEYTGDGLDSQQYELTLLNAVIDPSNADRLTVLVDGVEWAYVSAFTGAPQEYRAYQNPDGTTYVVFGLAADGAAPPSGDLIEVLYLISGAQKRYALAYDKNDAPTISFGDDNTGKIPAIGAEIKVTCRTGGGPVGNVDIGAVDAVVQGKLSTALGESTEVRVYNYGKGSGGNAREALDHAKFYAPDWAKSNGRAVTPSDWEVLAATFQDPRYGGPAYAAAKLHQEIPESNQVDVAIWSRDADGRLTTAGASLKAGVKKYLQARKTMCTYVEMVDGTTYYFDVYLAVSLKAGFYTTTVFSDLDAAVVAFFDSAMVMPGRDIRVNELYRKLNAVEGVHSVTIEDIIGSVLLQTSETADGATQTFSWLFDSPLGQDLVPESLEVRAGTQYASDDGEGAVTGDVDGTLTNTIGYETGRVTVSFLTTPAINTNVTAEVRYYARLEWEEDITDEMTGTALLDHVAEYEPIVERPPVGIAEGQVIDFYVPDWLMPIVPGRLYFVGGYGAPLGSPFGSELHAYDDGEGNIVGDVDGTATSAVDYRTGRVQFTWQAVPYYDVPTPFVGTLSPNPNGVITDFTYSVAGWVPGYAGVVKLDFSAFPTWGAEAAFFDNWQGRVFGPYLDNRSDNTFVDALGTGELHFTVPPQWPGAATFPVVRTSVTQMLYSAFVFFVKTPTAPGHDLHLYGDNEGRLWGTTLDAYPISRLDHETGKALARLSAPVSSGRLAILSYDARLGSAVRNTPIHSNAIGAFGRTAPRELEEEIDL